MANPRVSLTAKQLETAIGVDLLALCQSFAADGRITEKEVSDLSRWLDDAKEAELPAIGFLRTTVSRILEDGKITKDELKELHQAIEKVLPPDYRAISAAARKETTQQDTAKRKPLTDFDSMVAGLTHEGRAYVVYEHARVGDPVFLVRDRKNRYSRAAIEVRLSNGMSIGFVPEEEAQRLAPMLDAGALQIASIKKIWSGKRTDVPIIAGHLYPADTEQEGCYAEKDCPPSVSIPANYVRLADTVMRGTEERRTKAAKPTGSGCALAATAIILAIIGIATIISFIV